MTVAILSELAASASSSVTRSVVVGLDRHLRLEPLRSSTLLRWRKVAQE